MMARVSSDLPAAGRPNALVVATANHHVPDWAASWCAHTGHRIRIVAVVEGLDCLTILTAWAGTSTLVSIRAPSARIGPCQVVAAVRDLPDDDRVLVEPSLAAGHLGAQLILAHVVPRSFGERSVGLPAAIEHGRRVLESGVERLGIEAPELVVIPQLRRQHPHELVGEELDADLLVLGGPRPRTPAHLGLIDSSAVQHAPCPILFAPRPARWRAESD